MKKLAEILAETEAFVKARETSFAGGFKRAQAVAGIDNMPGSEHDSKVPSEYKKPDPEVDDGSQGPEGVFSNIDGAGDTDPTMKHVLEVDEPAETPDQEPLITDEADAEPKTASATKLANKLLSRIEKFQATKRATNQKLDLQLTPEMLDKLAAQKKAAEAKPAAPKPSAKDAAKELLNKIAAAKAERQGAEDALHDVLDAAYQQGARDTVEKLAQMMDPAALGAAPVADPSAMGGQDAMAAMAGAPAEVTPPEAAPAPADGAEGAEGGEGADLEVPDNLEGEDISAEDIVEALDSAVESGELDPETAQAVLSELAAAEGGEGEVAADKEAAEKFASAIVEADNEIHAEAEEQVKFAQAIDEAAAEIEDAEGGDDEGDEDAPTVEEVQQAVAELVDEGKIDADTGAAILESVGADEGEAGIEDEGGDKEASDKTPDAFADAIKEASDECAAAAAEAGDEGAGEDEISAGDLVRGIAELVDSGEVSPEDAEEALHAIIGDEDAGDAE